MGDNDGCPEFALTRMIPALRLCRPWSIILILFDGMENILKSIRANRAKLLQFDLDTFVAEGLCIRLPLYLPLPLRLDVADIIDAGEPFLISPPS